MNDQNIPEYINYEIIKSVIRQLLKKDDEIISYSLDLEESIACNENHFIDGIKELPDAYGKEKSGYKRLKYAAKATKSAGKSAKSAVRKPFISEIMRSEGNELVISPLFSEPYVRLYSLDTDEIVYVKKDDIIKILSEGNYLERIVSKGKTDVAVMVIWL
jgi:hypothetical protein